MTNAPERKLVAFAAVFTVSDVGRSLEFYLGWLGFREFFRWAIRPATPSWNAMPSRCI